MAIGSDDSWMTPFIKYLKNGDLPEDKSEARRIRLKAPKYVIHNDTLYRRGHLQPLLRCVSASEVDYLIREVHEGVRGSHQGSRSIAKRLLRAGYYWPTMFEDTHAHV